MERISLIMGAYGIGDKKRMTLAQALSVIMSTGGFWKGLGPCVLRDAPFSAIYFPLYATLKDEYSMGSFLSGGLAGGIAAFVVTPADVIKTRMQTTSHSTFYAAIASIQAQGIATYFTGSGLRAMRSSLQFAVNFYLIESLNKKFGEQSAPN
jgi:solute carrier family 25 aspartate/glutamate transporter 12/13